MSSPEKRQTPWEELGISRMKFTTLAVREISGKIGSILKSGIRTEVHPKGKNTGITIAKGLTAYSIGQVIGHEFYVIPNITEIVQAYHGTVETSVEIYESREEIKDLVIATLQEKEFIDYVNLVWDSLKNISISMWELPVKEKIGAYLELAIFGAISGYMKNMNAKRKNGRTTLGILKKFRDNPELRKRFHQMKQYKKDMQD